MQLALSCIFLQTTFAMFITIQTLKAEIRFAHIGNGKIIPIEKPKISVSTVSSNEKLPVYEKKSTGEKFSFLLDSNHDERIRTNNNQLHVESKQNLGEEPKKPSELITNNDVEVLQSFVKKLKSSLVKPGGSAAQKHNNRKRENSQKTSKNTKKLENDEGVFIHRPNLQQKLAVQRYDDLEEKNNKKPKISIGRNHGFPDKNNSFEKQTNSQENSKNADHLENENGVFINNSNLQRKLENAKRPAMNQIGMVNSNNDLKSQEKHKYLTTQHVPKNAGTLGNPESNKHSSANISQNETKNGTAANRLNVLSNSDMDALLALANEWKRLNSTKTTRNNTEMQNYNSKDLLEKVIKLKPKKHLDSNNTSAHSNHKVGVIETSPKKRPDLKLLKNDKGFHESQIQTLPVAVPKNESSSVSFTDPGKELKETVDRAIVNTTQQLMAFLKLEKQLTQPLYTSNKMNDIDSASSITKLVNTIRKTHESLDAAENEKKNGRTKKQETDLEMNKSENKVVKNKTESRPQEQNIISESAHNVVKPDINKNNQLDQQRSQNVEQQQYRQQKQQQQQLLQQQKQQPQQEQQQLHQLQIELQNDLPVKAQTQQQEKEQPLSQNEQVRIVPVQHDQMNEGQRVHNQMNQEQRIDTEIQYTQQQHAQQQHDQQQIHDEYKQGILHTDKNIATGNVQQQQEREKGETSFSPYSNYSTIESGEKEVLKPARNFRLKTMKHLIASLIEDPFNNWIYHQKSFEELGITPSLLKSGIVNLGSSKAMQNVVRKAVMGKTIKMVVVGGSISAGGGLWKDRGNTDGVYHKALSDWWRKTITSVTRSNIDVNNVAIGGTDSEYFSYCLTNFLQSNPDLVLWELSANDYNKYNERDFDPSKPLEQLTRLILQLPSHPALIYVNFFRGDRQKFELNEKCPDSEQTEVDILSRYYNIPSLSWRQMVCSLITKRTFVQRELFSNDGYHPSLLGHAQVAILLTMYIKGVFESVLADDLENTKKFNDDDDDLGVKDSESFQLKIPAFKDPLYPQPRCWTLLTPDYTNNYRNTLNDVNVLNGDGFELNNVTAWDIRTDRVQCLLATKPGATLDLSLNVPVLDDDQNLPLSEAQTRTLAIATHNQYGGAADVQLDELPSKMSFVTERGSFKQTKVHIVSDNVRPGVHNLQFRSLSSGFCLTSIMVL